MVGINNWNQWACDERFWVQVKKFGALLLFEEKVIIAEAL